MTSAYPHEHDAACAALDDAIAQLGAPPVSYYQSTMAERIERTTRRMEERRDQVRAFLDRPTGDGPVVYYESPGEPMPSPTPCEHDTLGCRDRTEHEAHTKTGDGRPCCGWPPACQTTTGPDREKIRAAITNAYYEARNSGGTMETAADAAADAVMALVLEAAR